MPTPLRAFLLWLVFLAAAILNGVFRQKMLVVRFGELGAHVLSSLLLSAVIFGATYLALPWLGLDSQRDAWVVGGCWLALTVAFEFLAGHYFFAVPWNTLLADYNVAAGRTWIVVLLVTLIAPAIARALRN